MALESSYRVFQSQMVPLLTPTVVSAKGLIMNRRGLIGSILGSLALLFTKPVAAIANKPETLYIPIWRLEDNTYVKVRMRDLKVGDIIKVMFETTGTPTICSYKVTAPPSRTEDLPSGDENWVVDLQRI
jgi:hypothetical protein